MIQIIVSIARQFIMYICQHLLLNLQNTLLSLPTEKSYENVNWALLGQHGIDQDKTHELKSRALITF